MQRPTFLLAMMILSSLLLADPTYISGTIADSAGSPIAGATVNIAMPGGQSLTATTNGQGLYEATTTLNTTGSVTPTITVSAAGYVSDTAIHHIPATGDGIPDTLVHDFTLYQGFYHSVVIQGTVVDSANAGLSGAQVSLTISVSTTSGGTTVILDSCLSGAGGSFTVTESVRGKIGYVNHVATKDGYTSATGSVFLPGGSVVTIPTIKLTRITVIDSLTYRVSGNVSAAGGSTPAGVQVIVSASENGGVFMADTLYPTIGFYSLSSGKIPRKQGDIDIAVRVSAPGYEPVAVDSTVPWSQAQTTINVTLALSSVLHPLTGRLQRCSAPPALYTVHGRRIGMADGRQPATRSAAPQILIAHGAGSQPAVLRR